MTERRRFGRYLILKPLERGGMGSVQLARREDRPGLFVLKQLLVEHEGNAAMVRRFRREAQLTPFLDHPRIARVVDAGTERGTFFLAFEHIAGETLSRLLRRLVAQGRWISPELSLHVAMEALDGLAYAHDAVDPSGKALGLVHRDLSPSNIMVGFSGLVKLIDFGIAFGSASELQTMPGAFVGTVRYMSPEQALGRPLDRRSDLYTLAVVLWELLTRRRLVPKRTLAEMVREVVERRSPPVHELTPELPPELSRVLARALRKEPGDRYATAPEFRQALREVPGLGDRVGPERVVELGRMVQELFPDEHREAEFLQAEAIPDPEDIRTLHLDSPRARTQEMPALDPAAELATADETRSGEQRFGGEGTESLEGWDEGGATQIAQAAADPTDEVSLPGDRGVSVLEETRTHAVAVPAWAGSLLAERTGPQDPPQGLGLAALPDPAGDALRTPREASPSEAPALEPRGEVREAARAGGSERSGGAAEREPPALEETMPGEVVLGPAAAPLVELRRERPRPEPRGAPRLERTAPRPEREGPVRPGRAWPRWILYVPPAVSAVVLVVALVLIERRKAAVPPPAPPATPRIAPSVRAERPLLEALEEARGRLFREGAGPRELDEVCDLARRLLSFAPPGGPPGADALERACRGRDRQALGEVVRSMLEASEGRR